MKRSRMVVVMSLTGLAGAAAAHPPFALLGTLPGYTSSIAWSGDFLGPTVVGECRGGPPESPVRAFVWVYGQGIQPIAANGSLVPAVARCVQGSLLTGNAQDGRAFVCEGGQCTALPDLNAAGTVEPTGVAYSSGTIVVVGRLHRSGYDDLPFRYESGAYRVIGPLPTGEVFGAANAISHDGSAVVGQVSRGNGQGGQAFIWTNVAGATGLGWFSTAGTPDSAATGTNGTTTVGYSTGGRLAVGAFRYTTAGGMVELGALPGAIESRATGVSIDGARITGYCTYPDGHAAPFIWDRWLGMVDVRNAVVASGGTIPPGWTLDHAWSIEGAGGAVGDAHDAEDHIQAYIALPRLCFANCDQSTASPLLNVADFACFLNRFAAGEDYANCDHSTTPPVLNVLDFMCFVDKYAAGCSV